MRDTYHAYSKLDDEALNAQVARRELSGTRTEIHIPNFLLLFLSQFGGIGIVVR